MMRTARLILISLLFAIGTQAADAAGGDDQFSLAASHYSAKRWQLAEQEFAGFARQYPDHPRAGEASFFLGESLVQQGRYADAQQHFAQFYATHKNHRLGRQALFRLGETAYFGGQISVARETLDGFIKQHPKDALVAYALPYLAGTMLAMSEGDDLQSKQLAVEAELLYRRSMDEFPQGPLGLTSRFGLVRAQHRQGKLDEAAVGYQALIDATDESIAIQSTYYLATIQFKANELEQAARLFQNVIVRGPETRWATACQGPLAVCYARAGQHEQARQAFQKWQDTTESTATSDALIFHLAEAALQHEQWEWAEQLFGQLTESKQTDRRAQGLSGVAWARYRSEKYQEALAAFRQLVREYPTNNLAQEAVYMEAVLFEKLQQPDQAITAYTSLLEKYAEHPRRPDALYRTAMLLEENQQQAEAIELYRRLISEHGADWSQIDVALYRYAWLLRDAGQGELAVEPFTVLNKNHRDSQFWPDATYRLASAALEQGDTATAQQLIDALVAAEPPPDIYAHTVYLQARIARSANDWKTVEAVFQRLIEQAPNNPLRPTAEFWLAEAAYQQDNFDAAGTRFKALAAQLETLSAGLRPVTLLRQAQLLAQQQRWEESLQIASRLDSDFGDFPQRAELDYVVGQAMVSQAKFTEARTAFSRAAPRDGSNKTETAAMAQWMIGETYMHQEDFESAMREYLRVEALYAYPQWQAVALLQAAKCSEKLNQPQQAAQLYQQILDKYPESQVSQQAASRLGKAGAASP